MYPSDLSDSEWEKIESLFKVNYSKGGRPLSNRRLSKDYEALWFLIVHNGAPEIDT